MAGILCAKRGSAAPALCPNCTLLAYPIFAETASANTEMPSATPEDLTAAILACIEAGARILNLSLALTQSSSKGERALGEALDHAARRGVIIVAAAGNQGTIGSTVITGHPWVIPVAACDLRGKPVNESNLGHSIGRRGLRAPGDQITSLGAQSQPLTLSGTSVAAPFVTGAIALAWSEFMCVSMTENAIFFAARRGVGRPDARPQTAAALQDCQRRQTGADLGWNRGLSGECRIEILKLIIDRVRNTTDLKTGGFLCQQ